MYSVVFLPAAEKFYKKIYHSDQSHFKRIRQAIQSLTTDPFQGKPLRHQLKGKYSLRVGAYRIIYSVAREKVTVYIFDIGHRRQIYL